MEPPRRVTNAASCSLFRSADNKSRPCRRSVIAIVRTFSYSFCAGQTQNWKSKIGDSPRLGAIIRCWAFGVSPVTQIHTPDPPPAARPPICPDCARIMRFVTSKPESEHTILRHVLFVCDCGRVGDQLIANA